MLQNRNAWISYHFLEYFISQIFWAFKTVTAVPLKNVQENIQYSSIIKEHNVLIGFQVEVPHRYYRCQWILPDFVIAIVVTKSGKLGLHACVCVCVHAVCVCVHWWQWWSVSQHEVDVTVEGGWYLGCFPVVWQAVLSYLQLPVY